MFDSPKHLQDSSERSPGPYVDQRRSLTIADKITDFTSKGQTVYVKDIDGSFRELVIS